MDAERALRIQRVEVPRIKALAVRKGPILFTEGKGKPYVVDPVAVKVGFPFARSSLWFAVNICWIREKELVREVAGGGSGAVYSVVCNTRCPRWRSPGAFVLAVIGRMGALASEPLCFHLLHVWSRSCQMW